MSKTEKLKKPTKKELDKLKKEDAGFKAVQEDVVSYMETRRQAIFNIARNYRLDPEELFQEAYEVALTCIRDYSPIYEKKNGEVVSVQFNTFFGSRLENRAMEMRNRDPEYQARQAMTEGMTSEEKDMFRADPPLLVQHLDHDSAMQEHLNQEVSMARHSEKDDMRYRISRDSFFDRKLSELVAKEKDEKKQAALLHVKVGGVYNFQEIAYHFGVTDSRASQVMNELMDAFYVQRLLDGDLEGVKYDFTKLKFNDKRIIRLLREALENADDKRTKELLDLFGDSYKDLKKVAKKAEKTKDTDTTEEQEKEEDVLSGEEVTPPAYEEVFTEEENEAYPLVEVGLRPINSLKPLDLEFRPPESEEEFKAFAAKFDDQNPLYPAMVTEDGEILDGERRIRAAKAHGRKEYLCLTRKVDKDFDKKLLRVVLNMRLHKSNKIEMYYAIKALSSLGLSQQKIADYLGTSRTNVLVYCKVRDKAAPVLRALFEDGFIQITNASTCVDLSEDQQGQVAGFIRRHGLAWSKGSKFNKLLKAVSEGKMDKLEMDVGGKSAPTGTVSSAGEPQAGDQAGGASSRQLQAMEQQIQSYSQSLKDAEVWASQREGVINRQREDLAQTKSELDALKRELEAAELMKFGSPKAIEEELKNMKQFYRLTERMTGAAHALEQVGGDVRRVELRRKQVLELMTLMDNLEQALNKLRLELYNRGAQVGVTKQVG